MDDRNRVNDAGHGRPQADGRVLTPGLAAKAQAYLFLTAGALGALGVLLPHPPRFDEAGMLAVQLASVVTAFGLLALGARTPRWFTRIGPYLAVLATTAVLLFTHSDASPYLLFYLWVAFYAFYFLSTREAIGLAAFATLNFALVLVAFRAGLVYTPELGSNEDVSAFVLLTGTVAVAGAFIVLLRSRVTRLIGQLSDAARLDPMTGLFNRRGFQEAVERELSRAQRTGRPVSVLQADCDLFKSYNIRLGNEAGDAALLGIGRILEESRRRVDVVARVGGEEFGVILPDTDQHEAFLVAERLRMRIAEMFSDQSIPLTVSFGVVNYPVHVRDSEGMQVAAENALYAAKVLGRDRSVLHSDEVAEILAAGGDGAHTRDEAQLATVLNLAEALDMRDEGTARHSQTVGRYCEMMARELGFSRDHSDRIRVAGVLHDIGKIGVADSILQKPGPLTDQEYAAMKKHPEIGARILGGSGLADIRRWVLAHHERPDGRGYPAGKSGDDVALEARILAVGDAYEAMTSDRVYRKAIGHDAARDELCKWAGQQFDADVVEAFLRALDADDSVNAPARSGGSEAR
jgi:diguanylate cyclase (GGDEF)-like protein/putative nucleotidyltransferase with HDIG domain